MLQQIDATYESMGKALDEDKLRQQELLARRLAARRNKRQKIKADLDTVNNQIEEKVV